MLKCKQAATLVISSDSEEDVSASNDGGKKSDRKKKVANAERKVRLTYDAIYIRLTYN